MAAGLAVALVAAGCSAGDAEPLASASVGEPAGAAAQATDAQASTAPVSVADLPEGETSDLPWSDRGRLHVGDATLGGQRRHLQARYAHGTTVVGNNLVGRTEWWLVERAGDGLRLRRLVRSDQPVDVTLSADGSTVVWREALGEDLRRVTAYDVAAKRRLGSIEVPVDTFCCTGNGELHVTSITNDGRVVWHTADRRPPVVWRPGQQRTVPLRGARARALTIGGWPGGVMWQARSGTSSTQGVYATIRRDGVVRRQGRVPTDQLGGWSPDGTVYAYVGQEDGRSRSPGTGKALWALDVTTGDRLRLGLAAEDHPLLAGWESPTEVLVLVPTGEDTSPGDSWVPQALVRCDVTTGACERAAGFPEHAVTTPMW